MTTHQFSPQSIRETLADATCYRRVILFLHAFVTTIVSLEKLPSSPLDWGRLIVSYPELIVQAFDEETITISDLQYVLAGRFARAMASFGLHANQQRIDLQGMDKKGSSSRVVTQ